VYPPTRQNAPPNGRLKTCEGATDMNGAGALGSASR